MSQENYPTLHLKTAIPMIRVRETVPLKKIELIKYFDSPSHQALSFRLNTHAGAVLPIGIELSDDGVLQGKAAKGAARKKIYKVGLIAQGTLTPPLHFDLQLQIFPAPIRAKVDKIHSMKMPKGSLNHDQGFSFGTTALLLIYFELGRIVEFAKLGKSQLDSCLECIRKRQEIAKVFDRFDSLTEQLLNKQEALTDAIVSQKEKECQRLTDEITHDDALRNQVMTQELPLLFDLENMIDDRLKEAERYFKEMPAQLREATLDYAYLIYLKQQLESIRIKRQEIRSRIPPKLRAQLPPEQASAAKQSAIQSTPKVG